jgi:hypothetical protein
VVLERDPLVRDQVNRLMGCVDLVDILDPAPAHVRFPSDRERA